MKRKVFLLIVVPLILSLLVYSVNATETQTVSPSDDAYTDQGAPTVNWNNEWLYVRDHTYLTLHSWLKFTIPSDVTIVTAKLYLYLHSLAFPAEMDISVHYSSDDSWTETTITWNNEPDYDSALDSETVYSTGKWYSWTVTSAVSSGDIVSFCLIAITNYPQAWFRSSEYSISGLRPYLQLTIATSEPDVDLTLLPSQLALAWGIDALAAGLFMSTLLIFAFLMPIMIYKKSGIIVLIVGFSLMSFCIAIGWLPVWIMLLASFLVAVMYALKIKDMI